MTNDHQSLMTNITGIILAGGKSKRIGTDKGLLNINLTTLPATNRQQSGRKTYVENIYRILKSVCRNIMIIANKPGFEKYGIPVYPDLVKNSGPLGGIYTGLTYSNTLHNLVVGCDMPFISKELLEYLIDHLINEEVIVPVADQKVQPLCALYSRNCLNKMKDHLKNKKLKMQQVLRQLHTKYLMIDETIDFYNSNLFFNVNTREDLKTLKECHKDTKTQRNTKIIL